MDNSIIAKVVEQMETLPSDMQRLVLEFARTLHTTTPHGIPGRHYLQFTHVIPRDDLRQMHQAIVTGCAQVTVNDW